MEWTQQDEWNQNRIQKAKKQIQAIIESGRLEVGTSRKPNDLASILRSAVILLNAAEIAMENEEKERKPMVL